MEKQPKSGKKILDKVPLFAGCIERFERISKGHIKYLLGSSKTRLKKIIESLDNEEGLPAEVLLNQDEFTEIGAKEETKLVKDFRAGKNSDDKELLRKRDEAITKLIKAHKPVFEKIAIKMDPTGFYTDDLVQIGLTNFIESLDCDHYEKKGRVIQFVLKIAHYQMERYLFMNRNPLNISFAIAEKLAKLEYIIQKSNENTTLDELINTICKEMETTEQKALDLLNLYYNRDYKTKPDSLPDPADLQDAGIERADLRNRLNAILKKLRPKMESVIRLKTEFYHDSHAPEGLNPDDEYSGKKIAKIFGVTASRVGQLFEKGLLILQRPYNTKYLEEFVPGKKAEKETKEQPVESKTEIIEFLKINDNGNEVEAITLEQYAKLFNVNVYWLGRIIKNSGIKRINSAAIPFNKVHHFNPMYRKDEIDKAIAKDAVEGEVVK